MVEGVNVRFSGELQRFIQERTGEAGTGSAIFSMFNSSRKLNRLQDYSKPNFQISDS